MNILLGILKIILFIISVFVAVILIILGFKKQVQQLIAFGLFLFGFKPIKVYGKHDTNSKVLVYNHPTFVEAFFVLNKISYKEVTFLKKTETLFFLKMFDFIIKQFNGILLNSNEGENTVQRMKESIKKHNHSIAIAPHMYKNKIPFSIRDTKMPKFRTGAFRVTDTVQPVIFLYDPKIPEKHYSNAIQSFVGLLNAPITGYESFMFYLKPITRLTNETVEAFAERTQEYMEAFMQPMHKLLEEQSDKNMPLIIPLAEK